MFAFGGQAVQLEIQASFRVASFVCSCLQILCYYASSYPDLQILARLPEV